MRLTILARIGEFDIELSWDDIGTKMVSEVVADLMDSAPEIKPRPRFQGNKNNTPEMPFNGVIDHTELVPAKDGKREFCLAHVKHDDGTIVPVRYFPPQKTWRAGEKVKVQKGSYGPELKEIDDSEAIPF